MIFLILTDMSLTDFLLAFMWIKNDKKENLEVVYYTHGDVISVVITYK